MPAAEADLQRSPRLPFPPINKSHILHCSCHFWHPKYRGVTPKARLIPLSQEFVKYLRADGILLPPDPNESATADEFEFEIPVRTSNLPPSEEDDEDSDDEEEPPMHDPSLEWPDVHSAIASTIRELGGKVAPKLNWSAPKDATWINPTNSMECRGPNDIYLMLKSSDFVTHDLEHAFDGCYDDDADDADDNDDGEFTDEITQNGESENGYKINSTEIPYTLMLRKWFALNPSVEFRCFVRKRRLLAISQRSVNHFEFLFDLEPKLRALVTEFFNRKIKDSFPDEDFTFDVYVPDPYQKVWLIDFNPWAPRTDPLLFSWLELLTMDGPEEILHGPDAAEESIFQPELRLIKRGDPEAYSFNTPQYSAHKLPRDVVEASQLGPGPLREFADQWKEVLNHQQPTR